MSDEIAKERTSSNLNSRKRLVLKDVYENEGVAGEQALGEYFGYKHVARGDIIGGDDGIDAYFTFEGSDKEYTVDVKTTEPHGKRLLVEVGEVRADIYILAHYYRETGTAKLLKWAWKSAVLKAPKIQWKKLNHELLLDDMRDIAELKKRFIKGRAVGSKYEQVATDKFVYRCITCGEIAHYGIGVNLRNDIVGTWYCFAHWPHK